MHTDIRVKRVKYANHHIIWTPSEETKEMVWKLVKIGTIDQSLALKYLRQSLLEHVIKVYP